MRFGRPPRGSRAGNRRRLPAPPTLNDVDAHLELFRGEVSRQFRFLVDRYGFAPVTHTDKRCVGFTAPPWTIWIIIESHHRSVDTHICHDDGTSPLHLPLNVLLQSRDVPTQVGTNAQTARAVIRSVGLQAKALAGALPDLMVPGGRQALYNAGARPGARVPL